MTVERCRSGTGFQEIGAKRRPVVPGYVVDSRMTGAPGLSRLATTLPACSMKERSGLPSFSGDGTVMIATSKPWTASSSVVGQ
jgi:hypothetical protein